MASDVAVAVDGSRDQWQVRNKKDTTVGCVGGTVGTVRDVQDRWDVAAAWDTVHIVVVVVEVLVQIVDTMVRSLGIADTECDGTSDSLVFAVALAAKKLVCSNCPALGNSNWGSAGDSCTVPGHCRSTRRVGSNSCCCCYSETDWEWRHKWSRRPVACS